jgi:hypothetical protein
MFYIRSMMEESPGARSPAGDVFAFSLSATEVSGDKNAKTEKRIPSVESGKPVLKRGGQPGNCNALKGGKTTAKRKAQRRGLRTFRQQTHALLAEAKLVIALERLRR